ncbi:unnamed protein product [Candida verbasci]|uniref:Uncharacterized protein n=1 Tax=Candida verbasci TaxID=1227364 RepID=A0A9W4TWB5_9ASCO|nr:unnamed protein product [Candida verbasci]
MSDIDIEYTLVNQLAYKFNKLINSQSNNDDLNNTSLKLINLMNKFKSLHPIFNELIEYLTQKNLLPDYVNQSWKDEIETNLTNELSIINTELQKLLDEPHEVLLDLENSEKLFIKIKPIVIKLIINCKFQVANSILNKFATIVDFSNQPKVEIQLIQNRYIEYSYLKYLVSLFQKIWFPMIDNDEFEENGNISNDSKLLILSSSSFKPLEKVYLTTVAYYKRNEIIFTANLDEFKYLTNLKFLHLSLLFKQFKFMEFMELFNELYFEEIFTTSDLRSNLLVMYGIVLIFLKPFNELNLNFNNDDSIIDLFNDDPTSIEFKFYNYVMIPLSNCNFKISKQKLDELNFEIMDYNFPISYNKLNFIDYIKLIIDLKNFFVIIQNVQQITRTKLLELIEIEETKQEEISNNLIGLIHGLELSKFGINYDVEEEMFTNNFNETEYVSKNIASLQLEIDELSSNLEADLLSTKATGLLFDKFYN